MILVLANSMEILCANGKHCFLQLRSTTLGSTNLAGKCLLHLIVLLNPT